MAITPSTPASLNQETIHQSASQPVDRPFQYVELNDGEIRLLSLDPGTLATPLTAKLEHVQLEPLLRSPPTDSNVQQAPTVYYEAISYAWGDPIFAYNLDIHDGGCLKITQSLHDALHHLRSPNSTRRLWADAVCINQQDLAERANQVRIMKTIFENAENVLAWLGPAMDTDALAYATMSCFPTEHYMTAYPSVLPAWEEKFSRMSCCPCCEIPFSTPSDEVATGILAIARLVDRAFFSRLWVVQEVAFARSIQVISGSHSIKWEHFRGFLWYFSKDLTDDNDYTFRDDSLGVSPSAVSLRQRRDILDQKYFVFEVNRHRAKTMSRHNLRSLNLSDQICALSGMDCSDPRDRVFAVRHILGIDEVPDYDPDYTLEVGLVYGRLINDQGVWSLLQEFLRLAGTGSTDRSHRFRPSWVPDLNFTRRMVLQCSSGLAQFSSPRTEISKPLVTLAPNAGLCLRVQTFGYIAELWPECSLGKFLSSEVPDRAAPTDAETTPDLLSTVSAFTHWYLQCRMVALRWISAVDIDNALLHLLSFSGPESWPDLSSIAPIILGFLEDDTATMPDAEDILPKPDHPPCALSLTQLIYMYLKKLPPHGPDPDHWELWAHHRTHDTLAFIRTAAGPDLLAWVPRTAAERDELCVTPGVSFPLTLGRRANGRRFLVGESYSVPVTVAQVFWDRPVVGEALRGRVFDSWSVKGEGEEEFAALVEGIPLVTLE